LGFEFQLAQIIFYQKYCILDHLKGLKNINMVVLNDITSETTQQALPVEFYLAANQTFSITLSGGTAQYNILVVPEAG
jgi:hypothetical protein